MLMVKTFKWGSVKLPEIKWRMYVMKALLVASRTQYLEVPRSNPVGSKRFFHYIFAALLNKMLFYIHLKYSMNIYFFILDSKIDAFAIKAGKRSRFNWKETTMPWFSTRIRKFPVSEDMGKIVLKGSKSVWMYLVYSEKDYIVHIAGFANRSKISRNSRDFITTFLFHIIHFHSFCFNFLDSVRLQFFAFDKVNHIKESSCTWAINGEGLKSLRNW